MYSAVKVGGVKLYDLARKGREIEREPRKITIHSLKVEHYADNEGIMRVSCSKGTYIRTLIHDIGQELGVGAIMTSLQRTRSGVFTLDDCYNLDDIRDYAMREGAGGLKTLLTPTDKLFDEYPKARLDATQTHLFGNGVILAADRIRLDKVYSGTYTVYAHNGQFLALAKIAEDHALEVIQRFSAPGGGANDDEEFTIDL
jgi:tRNA pseudouridine55 synthase